jgi:hypothetical protein
LQLLRGWAISERGSEDMTVKPLTQRDIDTLQELALAGDNMRRLGRADMWVKPMDCGGRNNSHHSRTLTKLAKRGLAEREAPWSLSMVRGSCRYRINDAGITELTARGLSTGVERGKA